MLLLYFFGEKKTQRTISQKVESSVHGPSGAVELRDEISAVAQWSMRRLMTTGKERKMGNNYLLYQFMTSEELLQF